MRRIVISVVICTHNRSHSLRTALGSFAHLRVPRDIEWEVVVVDNNSTDDTRAVVEAFSDAQWINLRYVQEPRIGLSYARNRGIEEAAGDVVSFIDDDVILDQGWLAAVHEAFSLYPAACVTGRVLLQPGLPKPAWWHDQYDEILGEFDRGSRIILSRALSGDVMGIGANLSFQSRVFKQHGLFRTDLGRQGKKLLMGEESEYYDRLRQKGELVVYYPHALLYHAPNTARFTRRYVRRWYFRIGQWEESYGRLQERAVAKLLGLPRWRYRMTVGNLLRSLFAYMAGRERDGFRNEIQAIQFLGSLYGTVERRFRKCAP